MSLWEIGACTLGVARSHGAKIEEALTEAEVAATLAALDARPIWERA